MLLDGQLHLLSASGYRTVTVSSPTFTDASSPML